MRQKIIDELKRIEQSEGIRILYAVEAGSRGWGFESKDSDWDVRFFYVHKIEWYLSIDSRSDHLEYRIDGVLDYSGWELRKTLRLFRKSNPSLLEWLRCPIIYLEPFSTAQQMRDLTSEYFSPESCMFHYLHMAMGNYREYLKGDYVRVKKYFYVLRPILACQWIERSNTMAPMEFRKLLDTQVDDKALKAAIEGLLNRKMKGEESDIQPRIEIINHFLEDRIAHYKKYLKRYSSRRQRELDTEKLDRLFRSTLKKVWNFCGGDRGIR